MEGKKERPEQTNKGKPQTRTTELIDGDELEGDG